MRAPYKKETNRKIWRANIDIAFRLHTIKPSVPSNELMRKERSRNESYLQNCSRQRNRTKKADPLVQMFQYSQMRRSSDSSRLGTASLDIAESPATRNLSAAKNPKRFDNNLYFTVNQFI